MEIRTGNSSDAQLMATMFRQMWLDNGVAEREIVSDWMQRTTQFLERAESEQDLRLFFATEDGRELGGAACQLFGGLYPNILRSSLRQYGYIWGVYVSADARTRGVGTLLTERCIAELRALGCTHAILHAAPMGKRIYERLGFQLNNEMRLELTL